MTETPEQRERRLAKNREKNRRWREKNRDYEKQRLADYRRRKTLEALGLDEADLR